ncbi:hypothetical protein BJF78_26260 [Pseudonocardia sp. CNS-139]|nr:hypothetical protein BJF78_26260 [Pseudonocardia sp. CNS-139]
MGRAARPPGRAEDGMSGQLIAMAAGAALAAAPLLLIAAVRRHSPDRSPGGDGPGGEATVRARRRSPGG